MLGMWQAWREKRKHKRIWLESLKERGYWEDLRIVERVILN